MNSGRLIECCVVAVLFAGVCGPAIAEEFPSSPEPSLYAGAVGIEWGGAVPSLLRMENSEAMTDVKLKDVLARVEELTKLQVWVDVQSMTDAGIDPDPESILPEWPAGETIERLKDRIPGSQGTELAWVIEQGLIMRCA